MAVVASRGVTTGRAVADVPVANRTGNSVSQREDLANFISMITRDETPFMSSIGKTKATAIFHEWQTDELQAPGNSRIGEGWDYVIPGQTGNIGGGETQSNATPDTAPGTPGGNVFNPTGPNRTRLGNYTQINGKTIAVSGTRRAIDQAGVADEYAYQLKKRGTEMRRDVEYDLVNTANLSSSSGTRSMGTYRAWINEAGNCQFAGSNSAAPASNPGTGTSAPTLGTRAQRGALSLADIDLVMQNIYQNGGKATKVMLSPKLRRDFSDLMVSDSGVRRNIDEGGKLRQSVDVYMSDFGDLMVVPNYIMGLGIGDTTYGDSAAFIYDPQWFAMATLRPMQEVEVGQRGDSTIGMFVEEQTLEVKNPQGCGAIYNLA